MRGRERRMLSARAHIKTTNQRRTGHMTLDQTYCPILPRLPIEVRHRAPVPAVGTRVVVDLLDPDRLQPRVPGTGQDQFDDVVGAGDALN